MNDPTARLNFLRADEIYRHNYPQSNPLVQEINKCLTKYKSS